MLTNRTLLFYLQTLITFLSMVIISLILVPDFENQVSNNLLKVTIAPFTAISLLIFLLFIFNKIIRDLDDKIYSLREILFGLSILIVITLIIVSGTGVVLTFLPTIDKKVFFVSILFCLIIFFLLRIANLYTMAVITGIAEGIILYIIFLY